MDRFNTEDIIRFLNKEMDAAEEREFEKALQKDDILREDYELYIKLNSALKSHVNRESMQDIAFRDTLSKFDKEYFKEKQIPIRKLAVNKLFYAAAAIIIALFLWAPWNQNHYDEFFDTKMVSVEERGESSTNILLKEATEAFNNEEYQQAKEKLQALLKTDKDNDMLKFYLGVSMIKTKEEGKSRDYLEQVFHGESIFKDEAAYYIAYSYLVEKKKEKAKEWLSEIDQDSDIYQKAQKMIKQL